MREGAMASDDGLSSLTAKLYAEVRESVRSLALHPPHSAQWAVVATRVARIGSIVESERALARRPAGTSANSSPAPAAAATTLWDPKGEEWCLRHLLEEGKINLLLRVVDAYTAHEWGGGGRGGGVDVGAQGAGAAGAAGDVGSASGASGEGLQAAASSSSSSLASSSSHPALPLPAEHGALCRSFEEGCASVFSAAWAHPEGVQTTDVSAAAVVLQKAMGLGLTPEAAAARPGVAALACAILSSLGGPAAVGALGEEKLVSALTAAGVWALLPTWAAACAVAGVCCEGAKGGAAAGGAGHSGGGGGGTPGGGGGLGARGSGGGGGVLGLSSSPSPRSSLALPSSSLLSPSSSSSLFSSPSSAPVPSVASSPLFAALVGASALMTGEEFALARTQALRGAGMACGCPGPDAVVSHMAKGGGGGGGGGGGVGVGVVADLALQAGALIAAAAASSAASPAASFSSSSTSTSSFSSPPAFSSSEPGPSVPSSLLLHAAACASLSRGPACAALCLSDPAVKRRGVRPLLDYLDAVARATRR